MTDRWLFALKHAVVTLLVAAALFCVVRFAWYPSFYYSLLNASGILILVSCSVMVVGPLLACIVYKSDKQKFFKDFIVILLLQVSALLMGAKVLYSERPIFLVFSVDRFVAVTANSIDERKVSPLVLLETLGMKTPVMVAAYFPKTDTLSFTLDVMDGAPDIELRPELYEPPLYQIDEIKGRGVSMSAVIQEYPDLASELSSTEVANTNLLAYPLVSLKGQDRLLLVDTGQLTPIKTFNVVPWVLLNKR